MEHIAAGADGVGAVIFVVGLFGDDAHHGDGVENGVIRLVQVKFHGGVIHGHGFVHHGEIRRSAFGIFQFIEGKGHIRGGEGVAVGEFHIVADGKGPGETVGTGFVIGGEVVDEVHLHIGGDEGALDQGFVNVFPGAPAENGVEAGGGFRGRGHGHHHIGAAAVVGGFVLTAAGGKGQGNNEAKAECHPFFLHFLKSPHNSSSRILWSTS